MRSSDFVHPIPREAIECKSYGFYHQRAFLSSTRRDVRSVAVANAVDASRGVCARHERTIGWSRRRRARAIDDDALTAFACVRPRRARDRGVHVRGGDGAGEREQSNAASEREVWVVVRDARRRRLR